MANNNRVVWSEGMFLRPQHFQQQERFLDNQLQSLFMPSHPNAWGFTELELDTEQLKLGKVSLRKLAGTFQDGTCFSMPDEDPLPQTIEIPVNTHDTEIILCLPIQRPESTNVGAIDDHLRYIKKQQPSRDTSSQQGLPADIEIACLNTELKLGTEDLSGYLVLPIAKVKQYEQDKPIELESEYIPPVLRCAASTFMKEKLDELLKLIQHRGDALAGRLTSSDRGSSAAFQDFMYLQLINRIQPLFSHYCSAHNVAPYEFYHQLIQFIGELSSFTDARMRPPEIPEYSHSSLTNMFASLFSTTREYLSTVAEQTANMLELTERKYGIHVAPINDRSQLDTCTFILSVKGKADKTELQRSLPSLVRIAPVEKIRDIISSQTSGIPIKPLASEPRQIPYFSGVVYFEIEQSGDLWEMMKKSGGFAVHVGMNIPELQMELWAIRTE